MRHSTKVCEARRDREKTVGRSGKGGAELLSWTKPVLPNNPNEDIGLRHPIMRAIFTAILSAQEWWMAAQPQ